MIKGSVTMAYCTTCGARLDDGEKFCTSCGAPVGAGHQQQSSQPKQQAVYADAGQNKKQLLYESKGGQNARVVVLIVCAAILAVCAIIFFWLSFARYSRHYIAGGYLGGGYMFTQQGRTMLCIIGFVFLLIVMKR